MKISGAELNHFIQEGWPHDDYFWDHDVFDDEAEPEATYDTDDLGDLYWQGDTEDPTGGKGLSLPGVIRKWRKDRVSRIVKIRVPNEMSDRDLRAALKVFGGTIERN